MLRSASTQIDGLPLWWLALMAAGLPLLATHTCFLVSALEGYIDWCVPYWDNCTSISRTGRQGSAYFIFKGTMLPAAVAGTAFWLLNGRWLRRMGAAGRSVGWLSWLGFGACVGLVIYTVVLGHIGETFHAIRRTGVILYFSLTFIAELLLSSRLMALPEWQRQGRQLLALCGVTLILGLLSVVLQVVAKGMYDQIDNAFEWTFALLINLHALWVAWLWRRSGFAAHLSLADDAGQ